MKKYIFIIPLTVLLMSLYLVPAWAYCYVVTGDDVWGYTCNIWEDGTQVTADSDYYYLKGYRWSYNSFYRPTPLEALTDARNAVSNNEIYGRDYYSQYVYDYYGPVFYGPFDTELNLPHVPNVDPDEPDEPEEEVNNWFKNLWDSLMDSLAITDDFSNDLYDWIFEGEDGDGGHSAGHSFEYVTPTPSPTPTPAPTPTPYTLDIVDNNGNPVYTITGIPNQTITINNTTNNENGDDFDIFEVDVKLLPSGGVSNPKDGLNSVMESNLDVLEDIDVTSVGASFSVLPQDWFLMLGAIICMPFIAGFISKLLK